MSFLKGLVSTGVLPSIQETQSPFNPPIYITTPKARRNVRNDALFHSLLVSVKTGNENDMLTKFLKLKPLVFPYSENGDAYDFILYFNERLRKLELSINTGLIL